METSSPGRRLDAFMVGLLRGPHQAAPHAAIGPWPDFDLFTLHIVFARYLQRMLRELQSDFVRRPVFATGDVLAQDRDAFVEISYNFVSHHHAAVRDKIDVKNAHTRSPWFRYPIAARTPGQIFLPQPASPAGHGPWPTP